jgi:hypothetical protein
MELFIRIVDGKPFEHPIIGDNFRQAFPDVDTNNLPPEFARFERVAYPDVVGVYEVYEGVTYELGGDVYKDVYHFRPMTDAEKAAKIAEAQAQPHPDNFVFSEAVCRWLPPQE